ncbi:MAG: glucan biosynthesis protein G [Burkholderiaceae bacterium]
MFRRALLLFCLSVALPCATFAQTRFGLDDVDREARTRAAQAWQPVAELRDVPDSYDSWRDLRYRRTRALWHDAALPFEAQFFPAGGSFNRPVDVREIVDGQVRPVPVTRGDFVQGAAQATDDPAPAPLAGVRLLHPLNQPGHFDEVISFLGASYFRALGAGQQYGSSARALAIDTTGGGTEEFPAFVRFWLERPAVDARSTTVYALLDSPRATGAYRFDIRPGATTQVDVHARIHLREKVTTFGVAPLTSMFFSGENQPAAGDFRPEVHDADGLQVATGDGEWIWRPLTRPGRAFATSFAVSSLRGFGLMQRDRQFTSYEDLEAQYQRRPSVWVEPIGDWGPGRVELLQLPARTETDDNIVAFWVPATAPRPGEPVVLAWRMHWASDRAPGPPAARVVQTRVGFGYRDKPLSDDQMQLHVDFAGGRLAMAPDGSKLQAIVSGNANVRVLATRLEPVPASGTWRMTLDVQRIDRRQPIELRAFLRQGADTVTETWAYALAAE